MLKNKRTISQACLITLFLLVTGNVSFDEAYGQTSKKTTATKQQDQKNVKRIRQYFGKAGTKGNDYSAESTAGVGGANKQGLKAKNTKNISKEIKKNMYKDKKSLDNAIKEVTSKK